MKTLNDMELSGKRVMIRCGFDVPIDDKGNIVEDSRIQISIPTIKYVLGKKPKQVIILTHIGRPKGGEEALKTNKVAKKLEELLKKTVVKVDGWEVTQDPIVILENLRFNNQEKSKDATERDKFGLMLATQADIYVNDAFSNCHRDEASMTSIPKFIPSCAGLSVQKEIETIGNAMKNPERPLVSVLGGLKADKINALRNLLKTADKVLVGGALAFLLLKKKGIEVGTSKIDLEGLKEDIKDILNNPKLILPIDAVVAPAIKADAKATIAPVNAIPKDQMALDIGPQTILIYEKEIAKGKTILWNGPIGVFEIDQFAFGTKKIAETIAETKAVTIVGGGDSEAAVNKFGYASKMTHVSSGGGASLELFEGKELIAIKALG